MIGIESTVAPGTTENIAKPILEEASGLKAGRDFNLIFSYERVMVGRLLHNLQYMPRIVGGYTPECAERGAELYRRIVKTDVYTTNCITAEIAKVTENAYRDVNIAFANEVALICESLGANVHEVRKYVNSLPHDPSDPSKNPYRMMMVPGAGVGGHCLPKDSWLLKYGVDNYGKTKVEPEVIVQSRRINDYMPTHMKNTHRGSPQREQYQTQRRENSHPRLRLPREQRRYTEHTRQTTVRLTERQNAEKSLSTTPMSEQEDGVNLTTDLEQALADADCIALVTKHREYYNIDLKQLKETMRTPIIVDGRNVFNPTDA